MQQMENTSKFEALNEGDKAYYRQRQRNRLHESVISLFVRRAEQQGLTKSDLAFITGKDKSIITRCLSAPSNLTLDTISDLMLAMDAEMGFEVLEFSEQEKLCHNFVHELLIDCDRNQNIWLTVRRDGQVASGDSCRSTFTSTKNHFRDIALRKLENA